MWRFRNPFRPLLAFCRKLLETLKKKKSYDIQGVRKVTIQSYKLLYSFIVYSFYTVSLYKVTIQFHCIVTLRTPCI